MRKEERRVIDTALFEYRRLRKLKWNRSYFGGSTQRHWDAVAALSKKRKG